MSVHLLVIFKIYSGLQKELEQPWSTNIFSFLDSVKILFCNYYIFILSRLSTKTFLIADWLLFSRCRISGWQSKLRQLKTMSYFSITLLKHRNASDQESSSIYKGNTVYNQLWLLKIKNSTLYRKTSSHKPKKYGWSLVQLHIMSTHETI